MILASVSCGPSVGSDSGSGSGSETAPPGSSGPTAPGSGTTTPVTTTAVDTTEGTGSSSTGPEPLPVCFDHPPASVPDPPAGCEQVFQRDATRQVDPTRPAGYWECDGRLGWPMHYRVAAVACNCEHHYPLCADGTPDDCNGNTCAPGQSCVNFNNYCGCVGQCNSDADCGPGQACLCAGSLSYTNRCIPADCLDDDDCSGDLRCKVSQDICYQPAALRCTTPADDCARHSDCMTNYCRWDEVEELWTCDQPAICE